MHNLNFRRAVGEDAIELARLRIQFALELSGEQPKEKVALLREQMTTYFSSATESGDCISVMAIYGSDTVGIGSVHVRKQPGNFKNPSGKWGYIMNMYTVPEYRKQGICGRILELLIDESRKEGITAFELHATEAGKPVYLKSGFQIHNEPTLRKFTLL